MPHSKATRPDPALEPGPARGKGGRRLSARRKLIEAGYAVISAKGFEASSITEIIENAGVGVGSFYNHFDSKEDLAKAIFSERADAFAVGLESAALATADAAAATCFAFRRLIEEVETDKVWASFIIQLEPSMQMFDGLLRGHARTALGFGVESGLLKVENLEAGITAIHAIMIATAKAMLDGALSSQEAHRASRFALRMFGVPDDRAAELSGLTMDALRGELANQPRKEAL